MDPQAAKLLTDIAGCPLIATALRGPHPCSAVVGAQPGGLGDERQVPEPWDGHLETAPLLFVSSNPSISGDEVYPRATWRAGDAEPDRGKWPAERLIDYFDGRFDATNERAPWIERGAYTRLSDGGLSGSVDFLAAVRNRATEAYQGVLGKPVIPGADYCLTEVVHCKSPKERGAKEAAATCGDRYLGRVLGLSPAPVIICLGAIAAGALRRLCDAEIYSAEIYSVAEATLGGRRRLVAFLPHPSRIGGIKKLTALSAEDRACLRDALIAHRRT